MEKKRFGGILGAKKWDAIIADCFQSGFSTVEALKQHETFEEFIERMDWQDIREKLVRAHDYGRTCARVEYRERLRYNLMAVAFWGFVMGLLVAGLMSMWVGNPPCS